MKSTLTVGAKTEFSFRVPANKTVPHLYPEAHEFAAMPTVFATGFMVGLMEWTCLKVLENHLDAGEGSLGIHINVSHLAATVPHQAVTVEAEVTKIEGRARVVPCEGPRRNRRDRRGRARAHDRAVGEVRREGEREGEACEGGWDLTSCLPLGSR